MGQILTVVGYAVGTYFGYPQLGAVIGGALGAATTKTPGQTGPRLGDLRVQGTEYGQAIPWVAGEPRLAGQVVWASDRREIANTEKVGKGGGQKVTTFTYEVDLLIVLTENVTTGVSRAWLNGELIVNRTTVKAGVWTGFTVYTGEEDQLPDPTYEAAVGVGNAPAYRGRTSVMIRGLQLGQGGQIGNLTWEVGAFFGQNTEYAFLANYENNYTDESQYAIVPTISDYPPTFEYTRPTGKFGVGVGGVGSFSNSNDAAISYVNSAYAVPSGDDFTLGMWVRVNATPTGNFLVMLRNTASGVATCSVQAQPTVIRFDAPSNLTADAAFTLHQWHFVAVSRNSNLLKYFFDGVLVSSASTAGTMLSGINEIRVLGNLTPDRHADATLDGIFFVNGTDLYPSAFDPPTEPFTAFNTFAPLPDTIDELMQRCGYSPDECDTSGLDSITRPVRGMALGQVTNTRSVLETLQTAFFYEPSKSDKIYFRQRPLDAIVSIPFDDLGAAPDAVNDEEPLALIVGNEMEVPAQVSLSYANTLSDYNVATEHSDRLLTGQETNQVVQIGLGMLPPEAKGVVDALLFDQIASLTRGTIRLPLKYAYLEPGDVFTATNQDGRQYRLRSQTKRDNLTIIEHECTLDDATALISSQITSGDYALTEDVRQIAPTIWEAMDIPILRDGDNQAGFYFALAPDRAAPEDEWPGAVAVRSWSADAFEQLFTSGDACVMGACTTTLGDFDGGSGRFDEGHTLTVRVTGELASTTRADMLEDLSLNAALVGSEVLRFRLAELLGAVDGENEYRLSGFVRGQRGTEQHIGTHVAAERFVLLNNSLRRVLNQNSEIGVVCEVKAVTLNTLLSAVTAEDFTDTGVALMPFSVAGLRALADGSDIVLTWNRRTRLSYRYGGTVGASVPLGEAAEAYRIDVYDGATLINTYTATDGTYTYAAADITADGFTTGDPITFVVRQLSEIVGPGFPATIERDAP
jgi:hypothetical protein